MLILKQVFGRYILGTASRACEWCKFRGRQYPTVLKITNWSWKPYMNALKIFRENGVHGEPHDSSAVQNCMAMCNGGLGLWLHRHFFTVCSDFKCFGERTLSRTNLHREINDVNRPWNGQAYMASHAWPVLHGPPYVAHLCVTDVKS